MHQQICLLHSLVCGLLLYSTVSCNSLDFLSENTLSTTRKANGNCIFTLVESIPENLTYPDGSPGTLSIYDAHIRLLENAQKSIHISSFYWTLRGQDLPHHDNTSHQGEDIFRRLKQFSQNQSMEVKIAQNISSDDTDLLASAGAEVRTVNFERLMHGGVLHTKMWLVDGIHFFIGSANFDWRSYTQVKELGVLVENCPILGKDVEKIFEVYWYLGKEGSKIPKKWPAEYSTNINANSPAIVHFNETSAPVYMSSSPPAFCPDGRSNDIDAILRVISSAKSFIYISVMDYFPAVIYSKPYKFWPTIDDELRRAVIERRVTLHLMTGHWSHTSRSMYVYIKSLAVLNRLQLGEVKVNLFTVPASEQQKRIPFARVNHCKFMVTDQHAYIGTSNWSGDYFISTGGVGFVLEQPLDGNKHTSEDRNLREQLKDLFVRDFTSNYSKPVYLF